MSRLAELTRKVDAFFARVAERHGADMQCATGCSDCCHVRLTITGVEAAAIRAHVAGWPDDRRRELARHGPGGVPDGSAGGAGGRPRMIDERSDVAGGGVPDGSAGGAGVRPRVIDRCAALDPAGRCRIYDARPLVCRSHGVPIRMTQRGLPVVQACQHNFTRTVPDADCILDQGTLSATLLAVDAEARRTSGPAPQRVDLAGLLADLAAI